MNAALHSMLRILGAAVALGVVLSAVAAPFLPTDDAQVLERLPGRGLPQLRELKALQASAAQAPDDLARTLPLATAYIRASRLEGDPRFLGYAQATLAPWWKDPDAPTKVLVLRATILQSSHQFAAALTDLDRVLQREPRNVQAILTRATILGVQGRHADARGDCARLSGVAPPVYGAICSAAIDSVTGKAREAYASLQRALDATPRSDEAGRLWGETLLGEIAHRRGDPAAERHFRAALAVGNKDAYLLAAYGDWLLDQGRPGDVVGLLQNENRNDTLLLRLALAQQALRRPEAAASIETLHARFEASHQRGDTVHARENARFELALRGDAKSALRYALDNWKVQREPADLRILAESAAAANDAAALATVQRWLTETGIEYPMLTIVASGKGVGNGVGK
jgi:Tfp pilus assembly protein PilF